MDPAGILAIIGTFATPIAIVWLVARGPKARAKAEIMKAEAMARLDEKRGYFSAVNAEETNMLLQDQQKRLEAMEEEFRFMRRLLEDKSGSKP
jgi:hypothetical protein